MSEDKIQKKLTTADIMKLGDGECYVMSRDGKGAVRMIAAPVTLRKSLGEIDVIQKKPMITKDGYSKLNQIANVNLLTPPTLIVDGVAQSNPYIERHPETKVIQSVAIRRVGIGYSPIGNLMAIDKTLFFNIRTYFMQDLQSKMKKFPASAALGKKSAPPKSRRVKEITGWKETGGGKSYPIFGEEKEVEFSAENCEYYEIEGGVGAWVDLTHPEILELYNTHTQRQKFGDRIAQSIVDRNILKDFMALGQVALEDKQDAVKVLVYGYRHDLDFHRVENLAGQIASGEVSHEQVEIRSGVVDVEYEEVVQAEAEAISPEEAAQGAEVAVSIAPAQEPFDAEPPEVHPPAKPTDPPSGPPSASPGVPEAPDEGEEANLQAEIIRGRDIVGIEKYRKILWEKFGTKSATYLNPDQQRELINALSRAADGGAE